MKPRIVTLLGTRPEIIKLSSLLPILDAESEHTLIHSGQHYDYAMSQVFFEQLGLPIPAYNLGVGSGSQFVVAEEGRERVPRQPERKRMARRDDLGSKSGR